MFNAVVLFSLGKQNKLRVYYLSWLKAKILKGEEVMTFNILVCGSLSYFVEVFVSDVISKLL